MSANAQLLVKTGRFLDSELSFHDLVEWVQDREQFWAGLPANSIARVLADTIMLAAYEFSEGVRDEPGVKELVSQLTLEPSPQS